MKWVFYQLDTIPDLSLSKYQSLEEMGVEGVLDKHSAFLRQWQKISLICNIGIHLFFVFLPQSKDNNTLKIILGFSYENSLLKEKILQIVQNSPLSDFYQFQLCDVNSCTTFIEQQEFTCKAIMKKCEQKKITEDESHLVLYTVEGWESENTARLYDMIRIAEAIAEPVCYHVSLYGINAYSTAQEALQKPIQHLRKKIFGRQNNIQLESTSSYHLKDIAAEDTLKCYEEFIDTTANSPCFQGNIQVYASNATTAQIVLNAACAESLEKGNCQIIVLPVKNCSILPETNNITLYHDLVPNSLQFWPTLFSLEEIEPFFRFPALYDGEIIGIQKETAPKLQSDGIYLGNTPHKEKAYISIKALNKHAFVCGVPGSGKTNTMLHLANSLWKTIFLNNNKYHVPFLVFEPAKKEYRELALFDIPELLIFSPSANTQFPFCINPFEFPIGLTLSEHITKLCQVFEGAFPMQPPAPFILDQSIENIYHNKGWEYSDINDGSKEYPTMSELYSEFENQVLNTNYDSEIQGNIRSVLEMRIGSLIRREKKDIFDVRKSIIKPEEWLKYPIILELESLGTEASNFTTLLICSLIREILKINPREAIDVSSSNDKKQISSPKLRHVILIEEAHNLIASQSQMDNAQDSNPKIAATQCIVDMLKEVRALGEGMIIADQLPTAMATDVIKNTNIKIVHRLTSADDRGLIGSTMSANDIQMEQISTYIPGQTLVSYEGLMRPFELQILNLEQHGSETPDDDTLYNLIKDKIGQREIRRRFEFRKWNALPNKISIALQLEKKYTNALRNYDFSSKTESQREDYLEQCLLRYQGLMSMKQLYQNQYDTFSQEFIASDIVSKISIAIKQIGRLYLEEIKRYLDMNSKED